VVIPARNEAGTIELCIESIFKAYSAIAKQVALWVVVAADLCTDSTVALARRALGDRGEVLEIVAGSAGTARRVGVRAALARLSEVPLSRIWIANTDADSYVPADWLSTQLAHADSGITAIAGIVELADSDRGDSAVHALFSSYYERRPDGTHDHVHGANLGVRADAYMQVGGWADKALAEDHCLWNRIKNQGWPVVSTTSLCVTTSSRFSGRAPGGFADTLHAHVLHAQALSTPRPCGQDAPFQQHDAL
jgi:glycosyltransferase involved in cell wall biosynthesis